MTVLSNGIAAPTTAKIGAASTVQTTSGAPSVIITPRGFVDVPDAVLNPGQIATDDALVKIAENAKFASARPEYFFLGYFKHGDTVPEPFSLIDNYNYDYSELLFHHTLYSSRAPGVGFTSGQTTAPAIAGGQPTNLYWYTADIDNATGLVALQVSYFKQGKVAETITHDGILKVYAHAQRQSVNTPS